MLACRTGDSLEWLLQRGRTLSYGVTIKAAFEVCLHFLHLSFHDFFLYDFLGDYGGRKQHWFPANFVQEIEPAPQDATDDEAANQDLMPLGDLQKGSIDILGAVVDIRDNPDRPAGVNGLEWIVRIETPTSRQPFEVAAQDQSEALEWAAKIRDTSRSASFREESNRKKERALRIARELSNLVIYCRSVVFNLDRNMKREARNHTEMSSFPVKIFQNM